MEKNYTEDLDRDATVKLTVKSLLEVVQTGAKNIEISVMERYGEITVSRALRDLLVADSMQNLPQSEIESIVNGIESEKEAEAERKRQRVAATQAGQAAMAMGSTGLSGTSTPQPSTGTGGAQQPGADSGVQ